MTDLWTHVEALRDRTAELEVHRKNDGGSFRSGPENTEAATLAKDLSDLAARLDRLVVK